MIFAKNIKSLQFGFGQNRPRGLEIWVNPFAKMSIFRLFELLVFRA